MHQSIAVFADFGASAAGTASAIDLNAFDLLLSLVFLFLHVLLDHFAVNIDLISPLAQSKLHQVILFQWHWLQRLKLKGLAFAEEECAIG